MAVCRYCCDDIEVEPNVGWVCTLSGDLGGTYDYCPVSPDEFHRPEERS
jgi:hypothetical protein